MSRRTSEANKAIASAWENEQQLVREGKGTRDWTPKQQQDILERGKAYDDNGKAFEGHHMKNAEKYPEYQGDPKNIQFLSRPEHFDAHAGNYQNPTNGYYDVRTGQTVDFGNNPPEPPKAEKLSSPIMGNNATNEQTTASNSIPKINSQTVAAEGGGSEAPPERTLGGNGSVNPSDCDVPIPKTNAANPDAASSVDPVSSSVNKGINF